MHVAYPGYCASEPGVGDGTRHIVQGRGWRCSPLQLPGHVGRVVERPGVQFGQEGVPVIAGVRVSSSPEGMVQLVHRELGCIPRRAPPLRWDRLDGKALLVNMEVPVPGYIGDLCCDFGQALFPAGEDSPWGWKNACVRPERDGGQAQG